MNQPMSSLRIAASFMICVAVVSFAASMAAAQAIPTGNWRKLPAPSCSPSGRGFQTFLNAVAWVPASQVGFAVGECRHDPQYYVNSPIIYRITPQGGGVPMPAYNNPSYAATVLNAVSADSASDIWAAGYSENPCCEWVINVQRSTGGAFRPVSCPNPGTSQNIAYGILAFAPNNVYIAGTYTTPTSANTYFAHWDGFSCTQIASPNPNVLNYFYAIAGSSPQDVWLVGMYGDTTHTIPLCMHYDGANFVQYDCPLGTGSVYNRLVSVSAIAGRYVWAGGYDDNLTMWWGLSDYFFAGSWRLAYGPLSQCFTDVYRVWGVAAVNPNFAWQVSECQGATIISFWNGRWNAYPGPIIPGVDYNVLFGVSAGDTHSALAAGSYNLQTPQGSGPALPYIALYTDQ